MSVKRLLLSLAIGFLGGALAAPPAAHAQIENAYSNSHPAEVPYDDGSEEDLNLDSELAIEARFNLPQHKVQQHRPRRVAQKPTAAGQDQDLPLLDLEEHPAEAPSARSPQRRIASVVEAVPKKQAAQKQAPKNQAQKLKQLQQKKSQMQLQLDDTRQQNQHRAKYVKVLEKDLKKAQSQLQQLQLELQQAQNESQRFVKATKKLNQKIKKMDEKTKATTQQIATTYSQQDQMKTELKKNLKEYKKKKKLQSQPKAN